MSKCQNLKLLSYEMTNRLVWACHSALYGFFVEGVSKVEKVRIGLLVGGYSIPAIPTQSTENEGRVGRAGMPYPPTFVAFNPYN